MKLRALLLVCLLAGGAYVMVQSVKEFQVKGFHDILPGSAAAVEQLIFSGPSSGGSDRPAWVVTDKEEIDRLLAFLQTVEVRKTDAQQALHEVDFNQFTVSLEDGDQNRITILPDDELIVNDEGEQFTIMDGSLDVNWLLRFMLTSQYKKD